MPVSRQALMTIDLGGEQVVLEQMRCSEALGEPFTLTVDIIADLGHVDMLPHLGKPVAVHLQEDDAPMRHFNGFLTEAEFRYETEAGLHYRLVAQPFTYFMAQNRDMAIFQSISVPDIIEKVFADAGEKNYELKLSQNYEKRRYCVQYRESDFGFLTRLMEEEGIYYFYRHEAERHVMIICDAPTAHEASTPASLRFEPASAGVQLAGSSLRGRQDYTLESFCERVASGGEAHVTLRAFNFKKPERPLEAVSADKQQHPTDVREVYDYPAKFVDELHSAVRLAAMRRQRQVYCGVSQATSLACGTKVTVTNHSQRLDQTYLVTRTEHLAVSEQHRSGASTDDDDDAHVSFEAVPEAVPFHMPQITPKPRVDGLETAIVSGPVGEKIFTDKYGRVKVRFHWDRADTTGENSTCWIRVAQFGNLGSLILPRVNQEVMVAFLHGDPDQPIVTGWVFNEGEMPIYGLPENKTRSLIRTKTYGDTGAYPNAQGLDSGAPGANELRFEDKGGHEEIYVHAERDMNTRIRLAETKHIGQNQTLDVGYDRTQTIGHDETKTVKHDQTLTVTNDQTEEITKGNRTIDIKTGNDTLTLDAGNIKTEAKMGNITVKADLGTIEIEAMQSITLKVGQSTVVIDQMGVTIKGMMLKNEAQIQSSTQAVMTDIKGSAMTTVKGGIVMVN